MVEGETVSELVCGYCGLSVVELNRKRDKELLPLMLVHPFVQQHQATQLF